MNLFTKSLRATLLTAVVSLALPLAASAMTLGVSDEIDSTVASGHVCTTSSSYSNNQGTEWTSSQSTKTGTEVDGAGASASVSDPAASGSSNSGTYQVNVVSSGGSSGTYNNGSQSSTSYTGLQDSTQIVNTVSTFANP